MIEREIVILVIFGLDQMVILTLILIVIRMSMAAKSTRTWGSSTPGRMAFLRKKGGRKSGLKTPLLDGTRISQHRGLIDVR